MAESRRMQSSAAIDAHVGTRIRECRTMAGLSQRQIAEVIGISFRQVHKYERGLNRVSAGRLYEIADVLDVPIVYFYDGLGDEALHPAAPSRPMLLETTRNFSAIPNEKHQQAFNQLVRVLAR